MGKPKRQQSDVAKAPKPLSKRGISFRALVVAPLVVALVVQAIVCYFVILRSDSLTMLEEDTYNLFAERVSSRAGYLENDMVMRWSETGETAQKLADTVSVVLSEYGADASDTGAASPLALEIIDRAADDVISFVRRSEIDGAYFVLADGAEDGSQGEAANRSALYVLDSNPDVNLENDSDLLLAACPISLAKRTDIALASSWEATLTMPSEEDGSGLCRAACGRSRISQRGSRRFGLLGASRRYRRHGQPFDHLQHSRQGCQRAGIRRVRRRSERQPPCHVLPVSRSRRCGARVLSSGCRRHVVGFRFVRCASGAGGVVRFRCRIVHRRRAEHLRRGRIVDGFRRRSGLSGCVCRRIGWQGGRCCRCEHDQALRLEFPVFLAAVVPHGDRARRDAVPRIRVARIEPFRHSRSIVRGRRPALSVVR